MWEYETKARKNIPKRLSRPSVPFTIPFDIVLEGIRMKRIYV